MKKIMLILVIIICFTGCNEKKDVKEKSKPIKKETKIEKKETYKDDNPIKLGIYKYNENNIPTLINEYTSNWINGKDISYFTIFYTQENQLSNESFITLYNKYKDNYKNINVKNGIMIEFNIGETTIKKTILNPKDVWQYFNYIEVYLYDDTFHQNDSWYSHTTEEEFNDNTIISTFKITAGAEMDKITSDINITAFTYDSDDDFKDGLYRGNSYYKLTLKRG